MKALALALLALTTACATTTTTDGGADGGLDAIEEPLPCQADASVPDGNFGVISATNPPHQNACTQAQTADYAQCQGAKNTSLCTQFKAGGPSAACGACIETQHDAPDGGTSTWGVIVFSGATAFFNVEGCVNDALGQTDPATSCGQKLFELYTCQAAACSTCTGSDFSSCELQVLHGVCATENDAAFSPTGPCGALVGDVVPADVFNCFPDTSITDSTSQEVDWLTRMVGYMCGP